MKAASNGYPLLQKILVGFGDKTVMRDNLPDALRDVGVIPGNAAKPDKGGATPKPEPPTQTVLLSQLAAALAEAQSAYNQGQEALKNGNFAAYGDAQKALEAALKRAQALQDQLNALAASGTKEGTTATAASP